MSTYSPKPGDITRSWHVIDADDVVLGRLAVTAATLLRGKHKPTYAPHMDGGDFVVVVNASKIALTGSKRTDKLARRHSGRPGGFSLSVAVSQPPEVERHREDGREAKRRIGTLFCLFGLLCVSLPLG